MDPERFSGFEGFDWDEGNATKNWEKHGVTQSECEQVFFNKPAMVAQDIDHSCSEDRYYLLGRTDAGRYLAVIFTVRRDLIRVVSARNMNRKEREEYVAMSLKRVPKFGSEDEEREFWAREDTTEYVDWTKAEEAAFPRLKPSTETISLRLPSLMLDELKSLANKRDVPYDALIKIFLGERIEAEYRNDSGRDDV